MWQVMLCGYPGRHAEFPNSPIIEVDELPAVVRHNRRRLPDGTLVEDVYAVNHSLPEQHLATADFMLTDVIEGGRGVVIERTPWGVQTVVSPGHEPT